jgi:hypothetical protein
LTSVGHQSFIGVGGALSGQSAVKVGTALLETN